MLCFSTSHPWCFLWFVCSRPRENIAVASIRVVWSRHLDDVPFFRRRSWLRSRFRRSRPEPLGDGPRSSRPQNRFGHLGASLRGATPGLPFSGSSPAGRARAPISAQVAPCAVRLGAHTPLAREATWPKVGGARRSGGQLGVAPVWRSTAPASAPATQPVPRALGSAEALPGRRRAAYTRPPPPPCASAPRGENVLHRCGAARGRVWRRSRPARARPAPHLGAS